MLSSAAFALIALALIAVFGSTGRANDGSYSRTTGLFDVVSGSNGTCSPACLCTGVAGYEGPTGLGTPNGATGF